MTKSVGIYWSRNAYMIFLKISVYSSIFPWRPFWNFFFNYCWVWDVVVCCCCCSSILKSMLLASASTSQARLGSQCLKVLDSLWQVPQQLKPTRAGVVLIGKPPGADAGRGGYRLGWNEKQLSWTQNCQVCFLMCIFLLFTELWNSQEFTGIFKVKLYHSSFLLLFKTNSTFWS